MVAQRRMLWRVGCIEWNSLFHDNGEALLEAVVIEMADHLAWPVLWRSLHQAEGLHPRSLTQKTNGALF
jgi:hypothetical protein